jgi:hypothetical protein
MCNIFHLQKERLYLLVQMSDMRVSTHGLLIVDWPLLFFVIYIFL